MSCASHYDQIVYVYTRTVLQPSLLLCASASRQHLRHRFSPYVQRLFVSDRSLQLVLASSQRIRKPAPCSRTFITQNKSVYHSILGLGVLCEAEGLRSGLQVVQDMYASHYGGSQHYPAPGPPQPHRPLPSQTGKLPQPYKARLRDSSANIGVNRKCMICSWPSEQYRLCKLHHFAAVPSGEYMSDLVARLKDVRQISMQCSYGLQGAQNVRCARCEQITPVPLAGGTQNTPKCTCMRWMHMLSVYVLYIIVQRLCIAGSNSAQLTCSNPQCRVMLMYPRGASQVQCSLCGTVNNSMEVRANLYHRHNCMVHLPVDACVKRLTVCLWLLLLYLTYSSISLATLDEVQLHRCFMTLHL